MPSKNDFPISAEMTLNCLKINLFLIKTSTDYGELLGLYLSSDKKAICDTLLYSACHLRFCISQHMGLKLDPNR